MDRKEQSPGELVGLTGKQKGKKFPLKFPLTRIGRDDSADLRLSMDDIAALHALVILSAEGPCVQGWEGASVFVNNEKVAQKVLRDKDILRVGPFQFQLRWHGEPKESLRIQAASVIANQVEATEKERQFRLHDENDSPEERAEPKQLDLEALHRQLNEARAHFRREKAESEAHIEEQFRDLTEAFDETEVREREAEAERSRLLNLRSRFIKRWKRHWASERKKLERLQEVVQTDFARSLADKAILATAQSEVLLRGQAQEQALSERENQIEVEHAAWEVLKREEQRQLDQKETSLQERAKHLDKQERQWRGEAKRLERQITKLRVESAGLESRIQNQRPIIDQLEKRRGPAVLAAISTREEISLSKFTTEIPEGGIYVKAPLKPEALELFKRREQLDRLAQGLADQQMVLVEQLDRLAMAKEFWRAEEKRLIGELEMLTKEMQIQEGELGQHEDQLQDREQQLADREEHIRQLRIQLETTQTRLTLQESSWSSDRERKRSELSQSLRQSERTQRTFDELTQRWQAEREQEKFHLQQEHQRIHVLRDQWIPVIQSEDQLKRWLSDREMLLAQEQLILEQARQSLLEKSENRHLAERKLERYRRHVRAAFRKEEANIEQQRNRIEAESESLRELFVAMTIRVQDTKQREAEVNARLAEVEKQQAALDLLQAEQFDQREIWMNEQATSRREIETLRQELTKWTVMSEPLQQRLAG